MFLGNLCTERSKPDTAEPAFGGGWELCVLGPIVSVFSVSPMVAKAAQNKHFPLWKVLTEVWVEGSSCCNTLGRLCFYLSPGPQEPICSHVTSLCHCSRMPLFFRVNWITAPQFTVGTSLELSLHFATWYQKLLTYLTYEEAGISGNKAHLDKLGNGDLPVLI